MAALLNILRVTALDVNFSAKAYSSGFMKAYLSFLTHVLPSNSRKSMEATYRRHERDKRRGYDQRVQEVEMGSFTPLVMSATGGMGRAAQVTFKRIASLLSSKGDEPYSTTIHWIRCVLSFSLLHSAVMCLRGARSHKRCPVSQSAIETPVDLASAVTAITHDM